MGKLEKNAVLLSTLGWCSLHHSCYHSDLILKVPQLILCEMLPEAPGYALTDWSPTFDFLQCFSSDSASVICMVLHVMEVSDNWGRLGLTYDGQLQTDPAKGLSPLHGSEPLFTQTLPTGESPALTPAGRQQ